MITRLRTSFATKLLAAGLALAVALIAGISAYLLVARSRESGAAALSNADNRALVVRQLLQRVTATESSTQANQLARVVGQLTGQLPERSLATLLANAHQYELPAETSVVLAADGHVIFVSSGPASDVTDLGGLPSVRAALGGDHVTGVETITVGGREVAAYDTAVPVVVTKTGRAAGAVVYLAPLGDQLQRFQQVINYPVVYVPVTRPDQIVRLSANGASAGTTPSDLARAVTTGAATAHGTYSAAGNSDVAGSLVPLAAPGSAEAAVYIGVEAPVADFTGDTRGDAASLAVLALGLLLLVALGIFLFVERFVQRPVAQLSRGVARIARGDYTADVAVASRDELGHLARDVNRMRAEIARYITEIEEARRRLDAAVERLGEVSRALTTTASGVAPLQHAVLDAAEAIAGPGSAAMLCAVEDGGLVVRMVHGIEGGPPNLDPWNVIPDLRAGRAVRVDTPPPGWNAGTLLAVPMFYQEQVSGALVVITRSGVQPGDDGQALRVLANNAAVALENTRLFEQERETVRRLRELDAMKSDFLATVQHELRTPLTAILGMSDLMEMCWAMWDDGPKLEAVSDIQLAARNLYDIVETMIDFSLLEAETLGLNPAMSPVRDAVDEAVTSVQQRVKGAMEVAVAVDVPPDLQVYADPNRLQQVIRALVDNAVKFTPPGGRVDIHAARNGRAGIAQIDVADTGVGIPPEAVPRIFERFYQVDNTATRKYGGTGMGLALVERLLQAHGATVEVESAVGRGSRFRLLWPIDPFQAAGEARRVAESRGDAPAVAG